MSFRSRSNLASSRNDRCDGRCVADTEGATMNFLFADHSDVFSPWGSIRFGASASRRYAKAPAIPFSVSHTRRLDDSSFDVIGHKVGTHIPWQIYRATTRDRLHLENVRIVHNEPGTH